MEGEKKNQLFEENENNTEKAKSTSILEADIESTDSRTTVPRTRGARSLSFEAIMKSVSDGVEEWPSKVHKAAIQRFGRMPRNSWGLAHKYYCEKFSTEVSLASFMKKARASASNSTAATTKEKAKQESPKRNKSTTNEKGFEADIQSLQETEFMIKTRSSLLAKIEEIKDRPVESGQATRKIPRMKLNQELLKALNDVIGETVEKNPPKNISDVARLLQATQETYQAAELKIYKKSEWKPAIEAKITNLKGKRDL